tara:strand:+ start:4919 stop:5242 length:324 start_codon:yes stop_codon:yes gene_type:complete
MAQFITIPSTATGYATATVPNGGPIQVPLNLVFDVKQTSATVTVIYFDNRLAAGQKTLTLTHTSTSGSGTLPVIANAIYAAINAAPGGTFVPVSMPSGIAVTSALYA